MSIENDIQAFGEELTMLREKYKIPAITGILFKDGYMAPFKLMGKGLISAADEHYCKEFANLIEGLSARISSSPGTFIEIKT